LRHLRGPFWFGPMGLEEVVLPLELATPPACLGQHIDIEVVHATLDHAPREHLAQHGGVVWPTERRRSTHLRKKAFIGTRPDGRVEAIPLQLVSHDCPPPTHLDFPGDLISTQAW
jgi:hypothetical protein